MSSMTLPVLMRHISKNEIPTKSRIFSPLRKNILFTITKTANLSSFESTRSSFLSLKFLSTETHAMNSVPGARTVLTAVDFAKAFDSVWHSALLSKHLPLGLPLCSVEWI